MSNIKNIDSEYVANTYARFPIEIVSGKGSVVTDDTGKEYIDLGAGIAVNIFGVNDEEWKKAVIAQLNKVQHTCNLYYSEPCALLAELLCKKTGMKKVFFGNSGAEANECAIKAARKYASIHKGEDAYTIVTLENSFHGRTLTTLAATGQEYFHKLYTPLTPGFISIPANDVEALEKTLTSVKCAGLLIECVQGEGGVKALSREFVTAAEKLCHETDTVFMTDEVQTGNGRTGELYAYMNYGVTPDVVSTAKGIGGGLPLGACLLGEKVKDVFAPGDHGSTFGGNPVACAGAINIINRIDEKLLADVKKKSEFIVSSLEGASGIEGVDGMGLMLGIRTVKKASDVVKECMDGGVICLTAKDKLRLLPALNIPMELLEKAVKVIKNACAI